MTEPRDNNEGAHDKGRRRRRRARWQMAGRVVASAVIRALLELLDQGRGEEEEGPGGE